MRGSSGLRAALIAAAASIGFSVAPGGLGLGMPGGIVQTAGSPRAKREQKTRRPNAADVSTYLSKAGWSNARYQRAARKRRAVKANRRAHRG